MQRVSGQNDPKQALIRLGKAVRKLRKERDISQEALAHLSSVDRSHLGRIERGERNLTLLNLLKVAQALEISAADMLLEADL